MSWSVSASGQVPDVAKTVVDTLAAYKCPEPEETIKAKAGAAIAAVLAAYPDGMHVSVSAYGSQSDYKNGKAVNDLNISIRRG